MIKHKTSATVLFNVEMNDTMPEAEQKELVNIINEAISYIELDLKEAFVDRLASNTNLHSIIGKINKWDIKVKVSNKGEKQ